MFSTNSSDDQSMFKDQFIVNFRNHLYFWGSRLGFLYLIIYLVFTFYIGDQFKVRSDIQALNRIMPDFTPLVDFTEKGIPIDEDTLDEQVLYFKSVLKHMSGFSAAHELLGLSYFYQGKMDKAEESLNKAVESNPEVFWFYYNQGIFYYRNKNYPKSIESFQKALKCDPKNTIQFMVSSRIYLPIFLASKADLNNEMSRRLQEGYSWAYQFMINGYLQQKDYQNVLKVSMIGMQTGLDRSWVYLYYVGLAAHFLNDFKTAGYYLQESIKQNPNYANSYYYLGLSIQALGKNDLANSLFERAKSLTTSVDELEEELDKKEIQIY